MVGPHVVKYAGMGAALGSEVLIFVWPVTLMAATDRTPWPLEPLLA